MGIGIYFYIFFIFDFLSSRLLYIPDDIINQKAGIKLV